MKQSRPSRFAAAVIALISMLFMQLAVASYACPQLSMDHGMQMAAATAEMPAQEMPDCQDMDREQPSLCHAHGQFGNQSLDKPEIPPVQPFAAVGLALPLILFDLTYRPVSVSLNTSFLARTTAPPVAIRHCCFRI